MKSKVVKAKQNVPFVDISKDEVLLSLYRF